MYSRAEKKSWLSLRDWKNYSWCAMEMSDDSGYDAFVARLQERLGDAFAT